MFWKHVFTDKRWTLLTSRGYPGSPAAATPGTSLSSYRFALSRSLAVTPDVQIVIDPANNDDADAVLVLGLRLHLQL